MYHLVWATCVHNTLAPVDFFLLHPNRLWWTWAHQFSYVPWLLPARGPCSTRISPSLTQLYQLYFLSGILRWVILVRQQGRGETTRSAGIPLEDQRELAGARPVVVMTNKITVHVCALFHHHFPISHSEFGLGDEDSWDDQGRESQSGKRMLKICLSVTNNKRLMGLWKLSTNAS